MSLGMATIRTEGNVLVDGHPARVEALAHAVAGFAPDDSNTI